MAYVSGDSAGADARRVRAHLVHLYTASGVVLAFLAAAEIASPEPDAVTALLLLIAAVLIDSTDGPLARRWQVKRWAPSIDGRTIDDIVDYLTYTFLPLLLVWRMGWLPEPGVLWVLPALVASLFAFANVGAKDEAHGFFLGFPSYWNVVAVYAGIWNHYYGAWINGAVILGLTVLSILPIRFVYPNLAPAPWRGMVIGGALIWMTMAGAMLVRYPAAPEWLMWLSLTYPAFYAGVSFHLARSVVRTRYAKAD